MQSLSRHPDFVQVTRVYHTIKAAGYQVFLAGGCVRDYLLGVLPNDFDIATNARPEQVQELFAKSIDVGKAFGVIVVVLDGVQVEVTTFRGDGEYTDGRRPNSVEFLGPREDALRRDFTVNALFMDLDSEEIIDYVEGEKDLYAKILRAVGAPEQRFAEDHLRMLRAVRFTAQLGFSLEKNTRDAILRFAPLITAVSPERKTEEMTKLLLCPARKAGLAALADTGLLRALLPGETNRDPEQFPELVPDSTATRAWIDFWWWARTAPNASFRFSREDQAAFARALLWSRDLTQLGQASIGLLVEEMLKPFSVYGYDLEKNVRAELAQPPFSVARKFAQDLGFQAPAPLITGAELLGQAQGALLGEVLRHVYFRQLEGVVKTKEEALASAKSFLSRGGT